MSTKSKKKIKKQIPKLDNWTIQGKTLIGNVYGNPRFTEGKVIHTSRIVAIDFRLRQVQTLNTLYQLGDPMLPEVVEDNFGKLFWTDADKALY